MIVRNVIDRFDKDKGHFKEVIWHDSDMPPESGNYFMTMRTDDDWISTEFMPPTKLVNFVDKILNWYDEVQLAKKLQSEEKLKKALEAK